MNVTSTYPLSSQLQWRGTLLIALSGMLYGLIGYLGTKLFTENFTVSSMLFWRFFIAALWMLLSILLIKKNKTQQVNSYSTSVLVKLILFGTMTYSGASAFYFIATQYIGTGIGMVIFFSFPIFVTLFAWILSDWKMNKQTIFSLIAVIVGLFFLKGDDGNHLNFIGILFAIMASFLYASYVYGSQPSAKSIDSRWLTLLICLGSATVFFIIMCYNHRFMIPSTRNAYLYICAIGILATAVPIQLVLEGLKYISPIKASMLSVLEPIITVLIGLILLGEKVTSMQSVGILIVLMGAILIQFERAVDHG